MLCEFCEIPNETPIDGLCSHGKSYRTQMSFEEELRAVTGAAIMESQSYLTNDACMDVGNHVATRCLKLMSEYVTMERPAPHSRTIAHLLHESYSVWLDAMLEAKTDEQRDTAGRRLRTLIGIGTTNEQLLEVARWVKRHGPQGTL